LNYRAVSSDAVGGKDVANGTARALHGGNVPASIELAMNQSALSLDARFLKSFRFLVWAAIIRASAEKAEAAFSIDFPILNLPPPPLHIPDIGDIHFRDP
jgi:hypothetical protein